MRHRRLLTRIASAAALLLVAGALLWAAWGPSSPDSATAGSIVIDVASTTNADAGYTETSDDSAPQASVASALPADTDWWALDLAHHLRAFELAALSGDMRAAEILGSRLAACLDAIRDPDGEQLRRTYGDLQKRQKEFYDLRVAEHAECVAVGPAPVLRYHEWLELAARSGSVRAMSTYASTAFNPFADHAELLANLDEVIRRRDLARQWAQQALRQGDSRVIGVLAEAYSGLGVLYPRDATRSRAYQDLNAMVMHHRRQDAAGFELIWEGGDPRLAGGSVTPEQQREALALAREMFDAWFRHAPRG
jgi:hypothetical protein